MFNTKCLIFSLFFFRHNPIPQTPSPTREGGVRDFNIPSTTSYYSGLTSKMPYKTNQRFGYLFYFGAGKEMLKLARQNRKHMTQAEKKLWQYLKERKIMGVKFRRQHPVSCFIADFYCHQMKLVIEIDGGYHNDPEQKILDQGREDELKDLDLIVIRFRNEEIEVDVAGVVDRIQKVVGERIKLNYAGQ